MDLQTAINTIISEKYESGVKKMNNKFDKYDELSKHLMKNKKFSDVVRSSDKTFSYKDFDIDTFKETKPGVVDIEISDSGTGKLKKMGTKKGYLTVQINSTDFNAIVNNILK